MSHLKALSQWLTEVLRDFIHTNAAHGAHCQGPDQRVWVFTILERGERWKARSIKFVSNHTCAHTHVCTLEKVFTARMARSGWDLA